MPSSTHGNYLATEVLTATPQKLHLMLIEAALRSCERVRRHWSNNELEEACEMLIHAQNIVTEMLTQLNHEGNGDLTKKVASVYLFVFRTLIEANVHRDEAKLDSAVKVLQVERETWRQVCEQSGSTQPSQPIPERPPVSEAAEPAVPVFDLPAPHGETATGFSLEA